MEDIGWNPEAGAGLKLEVRYRHSFLHTPL